MTCRLNRVAVVGNSVLKGAIIHADVVTESKNISKKMVNIWNLLIEN